MADERKLDKTALKILEMLKQYNLTGRFLKLKEKYGTYDAIEKKENILYPICLREGVFFRKFLRDLGEDEYKWKEKLGLALMYHRDEDCIVEGEENGKE